MKPIAFAPIVLTLISAAGALANPIAVFGSGTFETSPRGKSGWSVSFTGSDDLNSVSATFQGFFGSPLDGFLTGSNQISPMGVFVDGQYFAPGFATFSLGGEAGNITGYDSQHRVVISQDLISVIVVNSYTCDDSAAVIRDCSGTFYVHSPEPGTATAMLLGAGLLLLVHCRRRKSGRLLRPTFS